MKNSSFFIYLSRKAYDENCTLVECNWNDFDLISKEVVKIIDIDNSKISGFYYNFYNWRLDREVAILYYKNDALYLYYQNSRIDIKSVKVRKFLFWKNIIVNNIIHINIYTPIRTIFLMTDQFPEAVEPIFDKFSELAEENGIIDQILFLKIEI